MSKEQVLNLVGHLIPSEEKVERDAIHVAVLPVIASMNLKRACWLEFTYEDNIQHVTNARSWALAVGVADPFHQRINIEVGTRFLMFMKPNTITGLRHDWTHPALEKAMGQRMKQELLDLPSSKTWLENLAASCDMTYSALIEELTSVARGESEYIHIGVDTPEAAYSEEIWEHYEKITNTVVPASIKRHGAPFSCAC